MAKISLTEENRQLRAQIEQMIRNKPKNWDWKAWLLIGMAVIIIVFIVIIFTGYDRVKNSEAAIAVRDVEIKALEAQRDQAKSAAEYHRQNADEALSKITSKEYYVTNKIIREQIPVDVRAMERDTLRRNITTKYQGGQ